MSGLEGGDELDGLDENGFEVSDDAWGDYSFGEFADLLSEEQADASAVFDFFN